MDLGDATSAPDQTILARRVAAGLRSVLCPERNPIKNLYLFCVTMPTAKCSS